MKNQLRKYAKEYRNTLNTEFLSEKIHKNLFSLPEWEKAKNIFCYYSIGHEVNTTKLFSENKNWFIPRIRGKELEICPYYQDEMITNKYNIPEPTSKAISADYIDMVIIPALIADKSGYRIGYGGGYYDRFLSKINTKILKVVLVYSDLFYEAATHDSFDVKCDIVITDKEIYKINC